MFIKGKFRQKKIIQPFKQCTAQENRTVMLRGFLLLLVGSVNYFTAKPYGRVSHYFTSCCWYKYVFYCLLLLLLLLLLLFYLMNLDEMELWSLPHRSCNRNLSKCKFKPEKHFQVFNGIHPVTGMRREMKLIWTADEMEVKWRCDLYFKSHSCDGYRWTR